MSDKVDINSVLDELKRLDAGVDSVEELDALKPIYYRVEEIGKEHTQDFDVQLLWADVKQHVVARGMKLKERGAVSSKQSAPVIPPPPVSSITSAVTTPVPLHVPTSGQTPPELRASGSQSTAAAPERAVYVPRAKTPPARPVYIAPAQPDWKKPILIGGGIGLAIVILLFGALAVFKHNTATPQPQPVNVTLVPLRVTTSPPGAAVSVNGQDRCMTNECKLDLHPGHYTLMLHMSGYENEVRTLDLKTGQPYSLALTLMPQLQALHINTDLKDGLQAQLDGKPAGTFQEGQLTLDSVAPGKHDLRITARGGAETAFSFEVKSGEAVVFTSPVTAKNVVALVASRFGKQLTVRSSQTPLQVSIDNEAKGEAGPDGLTVRDVAPGDREMEIGAGQDRRRVVVAAASAPTLTVWINGDVSKGSLFIQAGTEDGVSVFLDGKRYPRTTKHGILRIQNVNPGDHQIRVAKDGFQPVQDKPFKVERGAEVKAVFALQAIPQIAILSVQGGPPGAQVLIDGSPAGRIQTDGTLSYDKITPGDHKVTVRLDGHTPKEFNRNFPAGGTVQLTAADVLLERITGVLRVSATPGNAVLTIRRKDDKRAAPLQTGSSKLAPGTYIITAAASGYNELTQTVQVAAGEASAPVVLKLTPVVTAVKPAVHYDWEKPGEWEEEENGWRMHRGGNFVAYSAQPALGTFSFAVQMRKGGNLIRGKKLQWYVNYVDPKNYAAFSVENRTFISRLVVSGKGKDHNRIILQTDAPYDFQVQVTPDRIVHRLAVDSKWQEIDSLDMPDAGQGKFGFFIPGKDELEVARFNFAPRK